METINKRLGTFRKDTMEVIDKFRKQGKIIEINGNYKVEEI